MAFHNPRLEPTSSTLSTYTRQYFFDDGTGAYYTPDQSSSVGMVIPDNYCMLPPPSRAYPEHLTFPPMMPFDASSSSMPSAYTSTAQSVLNDALYHPLTKTWNFPPLGRNQAPNDARLPAFSREARHIRGLSQGSTSSDVGLTAGVQGSASRTGYFRSDLGRSSPNEQSTQDPFQPLVRSHYVPSPSTQYNQQQISPSAALYRSSHPGSSSSPEVYLLPPLQAPAMAPERTPQLANTPPHSPLNGRHHSTQDSISSASSTLLSSPETRHSPSAFSNHSPELHQALIPTAQVAPKTLLPSPDLSVSPPSVPRPQVQRLDSVAEDDLNLIPSEGIDGATVGSGGSPGTAKASIFECPGCDLTFTRLSALKQHMLSHTGEKPHACDHCGRRFSLASNLRRHTSTKACKVLKFEKVKENISAEPANHAPTTAPSTVLNQIATPVAPVEPESPPKKDKKRKASDPPKQSAPRRKRHANHDSRWIPLTLALFKNAHLLTSTPPFQFCMYRARPQPVPSTDDEEDEPFTRPTLPLHPVRPTVSHVSIRSSSSSDTTSSSGSDGGHVDVDSGGEERNSFEEAPEYPYHPRSWSGVLPGPGLLSGDELVKNPSVARRWMSFKR